MSALLSRFLDYHSDQLPLCRNASSSTLREICAAICSVSVPIREGVEGHLGMEQRRLVPADSFNEGHDNNSESGSGPAIVFLLDDAAGSREVQAYASLIEGWRRLTMYRIFQEVMSW
jgi:hypothetical protein